MPGKYTVEEIKEEVFRREQNGETNRETAERYGLTKRQIKQSVNRTDRKERAIRNVYFQR